MSGDERFALIVCAAVACWRVLRWGVFYFKSPTLGRSRMMRIGFVAIPLACVVGMIVLLRLFSAHDVRDSVMYMCFYTVMGVAWLCLVLWPAGFIGLDLRDDVIERHNPAAAWAATGLLIGLTLGFTGGNIGDGPGWWVVVFCAAIETIAFYLLWLIAEPVARFTESVTVERDTACGVRFAALLIASGLLLGRAVAGDWVSAEATLGDFVRAAWPVAPLWAFAVILELLLLRPNAEREPGNVIMAGAFPGLLYLGAAGGWLSHLGWW